MRCQEIVAVLRESLDRSAGPIASQLDDLYEFVLQRLVSGNMQKDPKPTEEAIQVLRGLLEAWQELALRPAPATQDSKSVSAAPEANRAPLGARSLVGAGLYAAGGRR
jgi:flagellin-specific chaperone FliS